MEKKPGDYVSDIHDSGYASKYLEKRLCAAGLIDSSGRQGESLDGQWNFRPDWYDTCLRANWPKAKDRDDSGRAMPVDWDWEGWDRMKVPSCWNTERKELFYFEGAGLYTRTFRYLKAHPDERAFLRFEGANYRTSVFLNGEHLGTHDGGSTPFCVEISGAAKEDNRIIVSVEAYRRPDRVPADNTDWFNYGGIYRDVGLFRTPPAFIKDWFLRLVPGSLFSEIELDVRVDAKDETGLRGKARLCIDELGIDAEFPVASGKGRLRLGAKPELWSPDNPKLYDIELSYLPDSRSRSDSSRDAIGFREIRVEGIDILLNGKPIFLKGINVHEDHIDLGKATNEQTISAAIAHLKELNGNYLRLAHYPHDPRFARMADRQGVLLWEELPVYWAMAFDNPATYADAENQLAELVLRDRNRASVAIWSVGNENADSDARLTFMSRLAAKARQLDGTRPVSAACLVDHEKLLIADRLTAELDIIGLNEYYGWYDPDFSKLEKLLSRSDPGKPVIISEFGADARSGQHGSADELFTEEHQESVYRRQTEVIGACPYVRGMSPWILYDFRCPRRLNRYQGLFNRKGLVDADRRTKKPAFDVLAEFYKGKS
jgi:beta-glucuronidase